MEIFFTFHSYMSDTTDVLAVDYYPYGYIDTYRNLSRYTGDSARMLQYWSDKLSLKGAIVLQAYALTQYDMGSLLCHMARLRPLSQLCADESPDAIKRYSIRGLRLFYGFRTSTYSDSDSPAQHWNDLVAAAFAPLPAPVPSPTPRPQECPSGWTCEDIGNPKLEGTQSLRGDLWTVEGAGWDIWSTKWVKADQFRYVWQELRGDGEFSARVTGQTDTNVAAKAGVMLRKTFDPVSPYYAVFMTPHDGIHVQYRSVFNQDTVDVSSHPGTLPCLPKDLKNWHNLQCIYIHRRHQLDYDSRFDSEHSRTQWGAHGRAFGHFP